MWSPGRGWEGAAWRAGMQPDSEQGFYQDVAVCGLSELGVYLPLSSPLPLSSHRGWTRQVVWWLGAGFLRGWLGDLLSHFPTSLWSN